MKWDIDEAYSTLWVASEAAKALLGSMKDKVGIRFTENLCHIKNLKFKWCTLEEENEKIGNFLVEKFKNKRFANKFIKDYKEFDKKTIKLLNKLDKKDFSKISDNELFSILKKTTDMYVENFDFGFIFEPMDFVMPTMIENHLKAKGYTQEEIADMLAIADITFLNREMQELIEIAKSPKQLELLKKHAYKYRWLQSAHVGKKEIPFSYFKNRLNEIKKKGFNKELKNLKKNILKKKRQILAKKPVDKETKQLLKIADIIAPPHDRRKEIFMRVIYTLDTARGEIAKRYGYTKDELSVYQAEDILKLKKGKKLDKKKAREMFKEVVFYADTKRKLWQYYTGKKAREIMKKELHEEFGEIKEIKGMVASLGKAKGAVKIIQGITEMHKMQKGDILVASMTKPQIVPAMRKASAIVTDEGGVTCHAAIVSRELGIPCIIGTKIASRALKDNDLVEVDAEIGVVRILKK
jgi:phosphohistidine swiveling domain-containing protein